MSTTWLSSCCGSRPGKTKQVSYSDPDQKHDSTRDMPTESHIALRIGQDQEAIVAKSPVSTSQFDVLSPIEPFVYQPLSSSTQIRLLLLEPGSEEDEIECSLIHTNIQAPIYEYTALSYTWGSIANQKRVLCGGKTHPVTANLYSALKRLRAKTYRCLWVDAMCINQSQEPEGLRERENQVRMMGDIFRYAQTVIVDLGDDSPNLSLALSFIEDVADRDFELQIPIDANGNFSYDLTVYDLPPQGDDKWTAWAELLGRPWFRRVWVLQEFALGNYVTMMCGNHFFDPMVLSRANDILAPLHLHHQFLVSSARKAYKIALETMPIFRTMVYYREAYQSQKPRPLGPLIDITRRAEATDPRDKVYAVLALRKYRQDSTFPISYSQSTVDVFVRFSRYLVEQDDVLSVLWSAEGPRTDAPSWTISVTPENTKSRDSAIVKGDSSGFLFSAASKLSPHAWITADRNVLAVSGILFDTVASIMDHKLSLAHLAGETYLYTLVDWIREAFAWCQGKYQSLRRYPDLKDAVYRTLIRDSSQDKLRIEDDFLQTFKHPDSQTDKLWSLAGRGEKVPDEMALAMHQEDFEKLHIYDACEGKRLAITVHGYLAIIHDVVGPGDDIALINGADVPFALRYNGQQNAYIFLRPCYVHGIMDGEALDQGMEIQTIRLC